MSFYARPSPQLARQVIADVFVLVWALAWILLGRALAGVIGLIAGPAREIRDQAGRIGVQMTDAASTSGRIPALGDELRRPFDSVAGSLDVIVRSCDAMVAAVEQAATLTGVLVAVIPIATLVAVWLPLRLRFARRNAAARAFLDSRADLDLFALRAMATQPLHLLAKVSDDPVAAWQEGDRRVVDALADLELRRCGLPTSGELGLSRPPTAPGTPGVG